MAWPGRVTRRAKEALQFGTGKKMKETSDERKAAEGKVMHLYKESSPAIETLFEWAYINHVAWSLVVVLLGFGV